MLPSMFGMGGTEILVILIVALLFLGPDKLPDAAKKISKGIRDIKRQSRALQRTIEDDEHIGGAIRDLKSALRGEDEPIRPKPIQPPKQLVEPAATPALPDPGTPEPLGEPLGQHDEHGALVAVSTTAVVEHGALQAATTTEVEHGALPVATTTAEVEHGALQAATTAAEHDTSSGGLTLRGIAVPTPASEPAPIPAAPILPSVVVPTPTPARDPDLASAEPTIRGVVAPRPPEASEAPAASHQPKLTMPLTAGERDGTPPTAAEDAELAALVKPAPNTIPRSSGAPSPSPSPSPAGPAAGSESKHG
jgi:sec-independent protein translocase protein TatB